jgi:stage II sporulation protein D
MSRQFLIKIFCCLLFYFFGCTPVTRTTRDNDSQKIKVESSVNSIRVLIDENNSSIDIEVNEPLHILAESKIVALVKKGNRINFKRNGQKISAAIQGKEFIENIFSISSAKDEFSIPYKGKKYKGKFTLINSGGSLQLINTIPLEEYLKGVLIGEMPLGKGTDYKEALKAFTICARTYALSKKDYQKNYDILPDVRDQVYSGMPEENKYINDIINETEGLILTFNNDRAVMFYHSTCGGYTEAAENIFTLNKLSYLSAIKDGNNSYCSISPRFNWEEKFTEQEFIQKLKKANLLPEKNFFIKSINISEKYESGRVKNLKIILIDSAGKEETVNLKGNSIRSILRRSNNAILFSILFEINMDPSNNVIITGKGNGHGVGLCQWGAINQSIQGKNSKEILAHYFPGTTILRNYD